MPGNTTNLYAGSAGHYPIGRMPYPPEIGDALALDGSETLLDVGCGPGSLMLVLAPRVREAVGVDADADMLAEASRQAARAGARNVSWRRLRAEDLPANLPPHDEITALVESYVGSAVKGRPWEDDVMREAGFIGPDEIEVGAGGVVDRSTDEIVASVFSLSYAAPDRFGTALPRFEAELRALLAKTSPAGVFSELRRDITLVTWR